MTRVSLTTTLIAGLGLSLAAVPSAQAQTTKCKTGKYLVSTASDPLKVERLRALDLPSRTDGYAPRCLVAEAAAAEIQRAGQDALPKTIKLMGARWNGGAWKCTYAGAASDPVRKATCKKQGSKRQRITMELSAR